MQTAHEPIAAGADRQEAELQLTRLAGHFHVERLKCVERVSPCTRVQQLFRFQSVLCLSNIETSRGAHQIPILIIRRHLLATRRHGRDTLRVRRRLRLARVDAVVAHGTVESHERFLQAV